MAKTNEQSVTVFLKSLDKSTLVMLKATHEVLDLIILTISIPSVGFGVWSVYNSIQKGDSFTSSLGVLIISLTYAFIYLTKGLAITDDYEDIKGEMRNRGLIKV